MKISKPTLLLDEIKCKGNIKNMYDKALANKLELRPHFKTHQSLAIGSWFKQIGVNRITVSSLAMAKYFSRDWQNITVAFPVNINEIELLNELASKVTINICVENIESVSFLKAYLNYKINVFIKIDVGYHRTGVNPLNIKLIDSILEKLSSCTHTKFVGFLGHSGHTYKCRSANEIREVHEHRPTVMRKLKNHYNRDYPNLIISLGDTPSCSVAENFSDVDEIRPGNFVFYDLMQHQIGSNNIHQIAIAMACPIVAIHRERLEIVVYGGGVHFSKERLKTEERVIFGLVVQNKEKAWGAVINEMYLKKLSQEHGIVAVPESLIDNYAIGDYLTFLPVHSCMTANLMQEYLIGNKVIQRM